MSPRLGARLALATFALAGCGDAEPDGTPEPAPVDSALVHVLTDLGLAEARAELAPDERRGDVRDSLRAVALDANDMRASDVERAQARLAADPETARTVYDAVDQALSAERFRPVAP